jgi:hypothetical protein
MPFEQGGLDALCGVYSIMFDSYKIRRLNRTNCTTAKSQGGRHHVLFPAQTYFLGGA